MNTTNILFICGGTFVGLDEIIGQRIGKKILGFAAKPEDVAKTREQTKGEILAQVEPDDLIRFGLIPEFIGRLPVTVTLNPLSTEDLVRIMIEPKNALIRQYEHFFKLEGAQLHFDNDALQAIARKALDRETGARAVRSIVESLLLDIMFHLPGRPDLREVRIALDHVQGKPYDIPPAPPNSEQAVQQESDDGKKSTRRKTRKSRRDNVA